MLISIHVPREGHDLSPETVLRVLDVFQSTCPARGTTFYPRVHHGGSPDFNPRAPRGARPKTQERQQQSLLFQSTCPARGTTSTLIDSLALVRAISIHVPREGHDSLQSGLSVDQSNFNPRAPRGARLRGRELLRQEHQFQSTCPARGTTNRRIRGRITRNNFNPRAPRGARLSLIEFAFLRLAFQSTCPARGTTCMSVLTLLIMRNFNPRAPRGARLINIHRTISAHSISIHVPREGHDACNEGKKKRKT